MLIPHTDPLYNHRLSKAASSLVIRLPFFGYLLFGSGVKVRAASIPTMSTNGVGIKCGVNFVLREDVEIVTFGLLHELLHIYLSHVGRMGSRNLHLWNIACDIYVNMMCAELLGTEIKGTLVPWKVPEQFIQPQPYAAGKTIEEIYDILDKMGQQNPNYPKTLLPGNGEIGDGTDMEEPKPGEDEDPQEDTAWQEEFRNDVSHAKALSEKTSFSKPLPSAVRSRMDKIMRPTLPWGTLLRGSISNDLGWDDASYCPPKMKYYPIILPQTKSTKERVLVLLIDISASVTDALIRIFISNVQAAAFRATKTVIVTFDAIVREHYETKKPRDIFTKVKFMSGAHSHTSAVDAFKIAKEANPSAVCCLTDGYIDLPDFKMKNTTFVIPEGGQPQPWGRTFVMEHPWR